MAVMPEFSNNTTTTVGILFQTTKKSAKIKEALSATKYNVVELHLDDFNSTPPSFDILLHKLTHAMVQSDRRLKNVVSFLENHPEIVLLDPLDFIKPLLYRLPLYTKLSNDFDSKLFHLPKTLCVQLALETPTSVCEKLGSFKFPLLCKSNVSCAVSLAHEMLILGSPDDLAMIWSVYRSENSLMLQEYINHGNVFYKAYQIGDTQHVETRPSLPDIDRKQLVKSVKFHTHELPFPSLKVLQQNLSSTSSSTDSHKQDRNNIVKRIEDIGNALKDELRLSLFGFDVIVDFETQQLLLLDVNYFPSFTGMKNLPSCLEKLINAVTN